MQARSGRVWGGSTIPEDAPHGAAFVDLLLALGAVGLLALSIDFAREWRAAYRPSVEIDLSVRALPAYALYSLSRGLTAYVLSLGFTLLYGYWAARDRVAERVLVPILDILQSIPVLGFMPGLVLGLVALFPRSNVGLELAAVLMIFTGQVWNMTFSFYASLRSIPPELSEMARVYGFSEWRRVRFVDLPFSTSGLVWNSMMSMAGGWFFLMISESFVLGDRDYRLPGLGSYMSVAVAKGDVQAMLLAILAMTLVIVALDRILWRPLVVWGERFRMEESGQREMGRSLVLDLLRRSRLVAWVDRWLAHSFAPLRRAPGAPRRAATPGELRRRLVLLTGLRVLLGAALLCGLGIGALRLSELVAGVGARAWLSILGQAFATLARVLTAVALGTLWTLPAGLAIGLSPWLSSLLQPVVQVVASFPAPMLFPLVVAGLHAAGVTLGWGSVVLMLLGTQWYVLFNVIAGAAAIPADLREAARSYRLSRVQTFRTLWAPAVFPYLVTGWVTAAGGAWNASIVSEAVSFRGETLTTVGLGAQISRAAEAADFPLLAASVCVMALMVVIFNRSVWRRCQNLAAERFSLSK
ncbi:MAG TPA: ABC transporter permease subunit [Myxococcota bacterium]|nr:ABC transporter permease subunit [Myxococcota bacterium]